MLTSVLVSVALLGQFAPTAGRYEMSERLRALDRAWVASPDKARRSAAVPKIARAFASPNTSEGCRALDEATATMEGRDPRIEDAVTLRFDPPYAEPKTTALLRVGWAYQPSQRGTVRISVGRTSVIATPGRSLTLEVHPEAMNPELLLNPEAGYFVPVRVGSVARGAYVSLIKRPRHRVSDLLKAKVPEAQEIAASLDRLMASTQAMDSDVPIIQQLFTAELLEDGRLKLDKAEQLPLVRQGNTVFRVAFPKSLLGAAPAAPVTVVVGLPGAGGSEGAFFEAYGSGLAVSEALKRGWSFVGVRPGPHAISDALAWLHQRRGLSVGRVFVIGHGSGADLALDSPGKPAALALLAPTATRLPDSLGGVPVFLAVGKQDPAASAVRQLAALLDGRPSTGFQEFEPCENQMIVADALPAVYRFFDGLQP